MGNKKPANEAPKPAVTTQKSKDTDKPPAKSISSTKTTHGSLTSTSAGSASHGASSAKNQREAWALHHWLQQTPRDEPWRPGSRKA